MNMCSKDAKENLTVFGLVFGGISFIVVAILLLQGLVFWGIGNLIIWAFSLSYTFTFFQGVALGLVVSVLRSIFKSTK